jgi:hypothetical protein
MVVMATMSMSSALWSRWPASVDFQLSCSDGVKVSSVTPFNSIEATTTPVGVIVGAKLGALVSPAFVGIAVGAGETY